MTSNAPQIEFGKLYRDHITGFDGICTGTASYISGCDQVLIVPAAGDKGEYREGHWFDDERVVDVEADKRVERTSRKGGPEFSPPT